MTSPAQRYAAAARKREFERSDLGRFVAHYDFELDEFQLQGCRAIDAGRGVLVAAPTGAGKTVVGEYAGLLGIELVGTGPLGASPLGTGLPAPGSLRAVLLKPRRLRGHANYQ